MLLKVIDNDFVRLVPHDLQVPGGAYSPHAENLSQIIREFYIGSRSVSMNTVEEMIFVSIVL